jgi:type IV pilus assembly protein PilX
MIAIKAHNTPARAIFSSKNVVKRKNINRQQGVTLILVLIFMVTLSLIVAVAMRSVITGDRAVANERDRALSFQAAESAGREAIAEIKDPNRIIVGNASFKAYPPALPLGGNADHWRTTSGIAAAADCKNPIPLTDAGVKRYKWDKAYTASDLNCSTVAKTTYDNGANPRYVVELMPGINISGTQAECWYRVTTRATGGTQEADVILQIMVSNIITGQIADCK